MSYTEEQLIAALRKLEKNWPDTHMLFSWSGSLCLMRKSLLPACGSESTNILESYNDAIVETFNRIESDGGDPD